MKLVVFFLVWLLGTLAWADLTIHGVEFRIAKSYRYDNKLHAYGPSHAFYNHILPNSIRAVDKAVVQENNDGSYTIFFSTLEQLLTNSVQISKDLNQRISLLVIEGHGLPGQMWYAKDDQEFATSQCDSYRSTFAMDDKTYGDKGYELPSKERVNTNRHLGSHYKRWPCSSDLDSWKDIVKRVPEITQSFASRAEVRFLSCLVGYGYSGKLFTEGVAKLLFAKSSGTVATATNYVVGDWSTTGGIAFWDYLSDDQLKRDSKIMVERMRSVDVMQEGTLRIATVEKGTLKTGLLKHQWFFSTNR